MAPLQMISQVRKSTATRTRCFIIIVSGRCKVRFTLTWWIYVHQWIISDEDLLIIKDDEHPEYRWATEVSEVDGRYLMLTVMRDISRVRAL